MVSSKTLLNLYVLGVVWLFAIATSTEVAQEQPKKESFLSRFFGKREEPTTELPEVEEPPMYSVEWYLLPMPENRAHLLEKLPFDMAKDVPEDCDEPIDAALEKRIRKFFSLRGLIFTGMNSFPLEVKEPGYTDSHENSETEDLPKYSVDWYLLPKPMNRACLRRKLPWELRNGVPKNCNEPISPKIEKRIRSFFSSSPLNQSLRQTFSYYCST